MTALLQTLIHLPENVAVTATLLIRFFTLWFGVTLGILTVVVWPKMLFGSELTKLDLNSIAAQKNVGLETDSVEAELAYKHR